MKDRPKHRPKCGLNKVVSILYGLPMFDEELERKLDAGEIVLGGCCVFGNDPTWRSVSCGHQWGGENNSIESNPERLG
jgi:hypothetical protein